MNNLIFRDQHRRVLFSKHEVTRIYLKRVLSDVSLPPEMHLNARLLLSRLPRNSSIVRIRNRCVLTGRPRGVYRFFKMSRIAFRNLALSGYLPGIRKASW